MIFLLSNNYLSIKYFSYLISLHITFILIEKVDSLIDVCLGYHVIPRINFVKRELTLRGDHDSCSQCFANLHKQRSIQKYSISPGTGKKSDEIKFNMYTSMKIDEALATGDSNVNN